MISLGSCHFHSSCRNVVQIIVAVRRELDRLEGEFVEPLFWNTERHVRFHEATGNEVGILTFLFHFIEAVTHDTVVGHFFICVRERAELDPSDTVIFRRGVLPEWPAFSVKIVCPITAPIGGAVVDLPCSVDPVSGPEEM